MRLVDVLAPRVKGSLGQLAITLFAGLLLALSAVPAAAQWTTNGNNINNTNSGNVGVGTASPGSRLTVVGPVQNGVYTVQIDSTAGGQAGSQHGILLIGTTATTYLTAGATTINGSAPHLNINGADNTNYISTLGNTGGFGRVLRLRSSASGALPVMQVEGSNGGTFILSAFADGNVGIGNANPTSKLFIGSGTPAVATLAGLNVALGGNSYISASNGVVNTFLGADGSPYGVVGTLSNHPVGIRTNNSERLRIDTAGNVGIGTTAPTERLEISGNLKLTGTGNINATGTIDAGNIKAKYQDVAEWVDSSQDLSPGTVVVLDPGKSNQVIASTSAYDSRVAGVISLQPGITLGEEAEGRVLVATTGRVKVRVDASNGPIRIGDLLVTSDREGVAMKSVAVKIGGVRIHRPGTLIGKALEPLAQGKGEILVLLSLQ
jgi:hypothetical protein